MNHDRFKDAPWYSPYTVIVGGAGGIGSWLTLLLSRLGYNIYLYDFDRVEEHNLGGQLFGINNIGQYKTASMQDICRRFSDNYQVTDMGKYEVISGMVENIMFTGFDNMAGRKAMYDNWKEHQLSKSKEYRKANPDEINVFIDGRLSAETGIIYIIDSKSKMTRYEAELFDDSEVAEANCTFRATSHCATLIASLMVSVLTNKITNKKLNINLREVPFKIEFEIPTLTQTVIL